MGSACRITDNPLVLLSLTQGIWDFWSDDQDVIEVFPSLSMIDLSKGGFYRDDDWPSTGMFCCVEKSRGKRGGGGGRVKVEKIWGKRRGLA